MIRNIIFDMGKVLIQFSPEKYVWRLGVTMEDEKLLLDQVLHSVEWVQMDRGILNDEDAVSHLCLRLPPRLHESIRKLVMEWDQPIVPVEGMYELVEELKNAGFGIYLLSNASSRHPQYWPRIPASRFFDGILVSYQVGIMKPREEIYRLLCSRYSLKPGECFFIDDQPANVEAARFCGIHGMVFHDSVDEVRAVLRQRGLL